MGIWKYRCYKDDRGKNVVTDWIAEKICVKGRADLKRSLEILACLDIKDWHKPNPASLTENHIYVIRFKDRNRTQWRVYGHHNKPNKSFVLSYYGTERGNKYEPSVDHCVGVCTEHMGKCSADWENRTCSCLSTTNISAAIPSDCGANRLA